LFRKAFRDELALFQKIRHPNVIQFLGAVTQSSPMMIVTEYLPKVFCPTTSWNMISWDVCWSLTVMWQNVAFLISFRHVLQGDLRDFLNRKGPLKPSTAVRFALDIARYLTTLVHWFYLGSSVWSIESHNQLFLSLCKGGYFKFLWFILIGLSPIE